MQPISISTTNKKLKQIPNFNLPPVKSCINAASCHKICYAKKAWRQYSNVRKSWGNNLTQCKTDLDSVEKQIIGNLAGTMPRYFRIHSSGDFYNQEYYDMWVRVAKAFPTINFLAYTKSPLDFTDKPKNLSLVISLMHETEKVNTKEYAHLPRAYAGDMALHTKRPNETTTTCGGSCDKCKMCWHLKASESVHFNIH